MRLLQADLFEKDASEHISRVFGFFFYQYGPDHFSLSEKWGYVLHRFQL